MSDVRTCKEVPALNLKPRAQPPFSPALMRTCRVVLLKIDACYLEQSTMLLTAIYVALL